MVHLINLAREPNNGECEVFDHWKTFTIKFHYTVFIQTGPKDTHVATYMWPK